jgi:hypothetical protein
VCFYGANPNLVEALILTGEEQRQWMMGGMRKAILFDAAFSGD